jgi:hypothetical protein
MKLLLFLFPFLKELFFDKKGEDELASPNFNHKSALRWWLFVALFTITGILFDKLTSVTMQVIDLQAKYSDASVNIKTKEKMIKRLTQDKERLTTALGVTVVDCHNKPKRNHRKKS